MQRSPTTVEAIPHLDEALAAIDAPHMRGIERPRRKRSVTTLLADGLYERFAPHIFSATQVSDGKPAPDLFLFAAEQMAALPERCLVIEDSVPGITGALAAGMTVLGFHGGSHCRPGRWRQRLRAAGAVRDVRRYAAIARPDRANRGRIRAPE